MNRFIASMIVTLSLGLSTNGLASQSGTQVSPSTINLSAIGIGDIGIHTQLPSSDCDKNSFQVEVLNGGLTGGYYIFPNGDLSIGVDSLGHYVVNIIESAWASIAGNLEVGEATFSIYGSCESIQGELLAEDTALIVNNFGVRR